MLRTPASTITAAVALTSLALGTYFSAQVFITDRMVDWARTQQANSETAARAIEVLNARLDGFDSSPLHDALRRLYGARANNAGNSQYARMLNSQMAVNHALRQIKTQPTRPNPYAFMARYTAYAGHSATRIGPMLDRAHELGPNEPYVIRTQSELGVQLWDSLPAHTRAEAIRAVNAYAATDAHGWRESFRHHVERRVACAALDPVPDALLKWCRTQ